MNLFPAHLKDCRKDENRYKYLYYEKQMTRKLFI